MWWHSDDEISFAALWCELNSASPLNHIIITITIII